MSDRVSVHGLLYHGQGRGTSFEDLWLDAPGPGEVSVRMTAAGVCHSDLHVVDDDWARPPETVLGHEGAGIVEALGPGVVERPQDAPVDEGGLRVGDLVALAWTAPCTACAACRRGQPWLCTDPRGAGHRLDPTAARLHRDDGGVVGVYSGVGTFCTRQVVAAEAAIALDPRTPPEVAALIGCAATTGIGSVRNTARVEAGQAAAVIGLGGVGLSALLAAIDAGADPLIAVDPEPAKRSLALDLGASEAVAPGDLQAVAKALPAGGPDHVLDCIGLAETVELALATVRPGGTVTLVGMPAQGTLASIDVYRFVQGGVRLLGSNYGSCIPSRDFPAIAVDMLDGRLPLQRLIAETIGLHDIHEAFAAMRRRDGLRRVVQFES